MAILAMMITVASWHCQPGRRYRTAHVRGCFTRCLRFCFNVCLCSTTSGCRSPSCTPGSRSMPGQQAEDTKHVGVERFIKLQKMFLCLSPKH
jgi:hypothetical protein